MTEKSCCFVGDIKSPKDAVDEFLEKGIEYLIKEKGITDFYIGNFSSVNLYFSAIVRSFNNKYPFVKTHLVVPYSMYIDLKHTYQVYRCFDTITMLNNPLEDINDVGTEEIITYMAQRCKYALTYSAKKSKTVKFMLDISGQLNIEIFELYTKTATNL